MSERQSAREVIAESLEVDCMLSTAERVTLDPREAAILAGAVIDALEADGFTVARLERAFNICDKNGRQALGWTDELEPLYRPAPTPQEHEPGTKENTT